MQQPQASDLVIARALIRLGWRLPASSLPVLQNVQPVVVLGDVVRFADVITGIDQTGGSAGQPAVTGTWILPSDTTYYVDRVVINSSTASNQRLWLLGAAEESTQADLGVQDLVLIAQGEATGGAGNTGACHVWKFSPPLQLIKGMTLVASQTNIATDTASTMEVHGTKDVSILSTIL